MNSSDQDYSGHRYTFQAPVWLTPAEMARRYELMHPAHKCLVGQLFSEETIERFAEMNPDVAWQIDVTLRFDKGRAVLRPIIAQH